jgi:hypothetical protein
MRVKSLLVVSFLLVSVMLFGAQTVPPHFNELPFMPARGDTDNYGYYFLRTGEPGGPSYNWIDITGIGTEVLGLTDDNNVGPFNIGFDFPYYWYIVDKFYVNANGGISFSDNTVYTPQGSTGFIFPSPNAPNDIVIPLGADLTFELGPPAECFYYSNNVDTLIVSFLKVPAWTGSGPVGEHSFQLILTRADSCIYFEWGEQIGNFYSNACCSGMENVIGNDGLQVFYNEPPSGFQYEAVKITPPDSTNYQALDIGVKDVISTDSKGVFFFPGDTYTLTTRVVNYGNVDATSFEVRIQVWDTSYVTQFTDTVDVSLLLAGEDTIITFTPNWSPPQKDNYLAFVQTVLSGDINPTNNTRDVEIEAINLPGWLMYDSNPTGGTLPATHWIGAGGGWGQEFEPPQYPIQIDSLLFYTSSNVTVPCPILLMDDDGPNGFPGTVLFTDTITIPGTGAWDIYSVAVSPPVTITSGKFYFGWVQMDSANPNNVHQDVGPFSRRCWELTGSWSPYRDRDLAEFLMRAYSSSAQGIVEDKRPTTYAFSLLPVRPNPVSGPTQICYMLPSEAAVSLKIYNLLGQEVATLVNEHKNAGVHTVSFDSEGLAQGVYFYRLTAGTKSLTRRLILLK